MACGSLGIAPFRAYPFFPFAFCLWKGGERGSGVRSAFLRARGGSALRGDVLQQFRRDLINGSVTARSSSTSFQECLREADHVAIQRSGTRRDGDGPSRCRRARQFIPALERANAWSCIVLATAHRQVEEGVGPPTTLPCPPALRLKRNIGMNVEKGLGRVEVTCPCTSPGAP